MNSHFESLFKQWKEVLKKEPSSQLFDRCLQDFHYWVPCWIEYAQFSIDSGNHDKAFQMSIKKLKVRSLVEPLRPKTHFILPKFHLRCKKSDC